MTCMPGRSRLFPGCDVMAAHPTSTTTRQQLDLMDIARCLSTNEHFISSEFASSEIRRNDISSHRIPNCALHSVHLHQLNLIFHEHRLKLGSFDYTNSEFLLFICSTLRFEPLLAKALTCKWFHRSRRFKKYTSTFKPNADMFILYVA